MTGPVPRGETQRQAPAVTPSTPDRFARALDAAAALLASGGPLSPAQVRSLQRAAAGGEPRALDHLAGALRGHGDLPGAMALLERAVMVEPGFAAGWNNLGGLRRECGDIAGAVAAFERTLELDPDSAPARFNLGALHHRAQHPERACEHLEHLLERSPRDAGALNLLGLARCDANEVDAGIDALRRALALQPEAPDIANNLGVALGYAGRFDEARETFERALRLAPRFGLAWENLLRTRRLCEADADLLNLLEGLAADERVAPFDRTCLHFALGKAWDDLDDADRAFAHLRIANEHVARTMPYDARRHDDVIARIIERCDESFVARCRDLAVADARPVFVVGMPRSGTTLVEQLLGRSPGIHPAGELPVVDRAVARLVLETGEPFPDVLASGPGRDARLAALAREIGEGVARLGHGAARIVDKMPENYLYLGLLYALLPNATFIHCLRDPRGTGLSLFFHRFASGHAYSYSLDAIAARHRSYARLMTHWRSLMGRRLVEVDYDALVTAPARAAERLFCETGAAWSEACLSSPGGGTVRTASSWQVRQPISASAAARWQRYDAYLGPLHGLAH